MYLPPKINRPDYTAVLKKLQPGTKWRTPYGKHNEYSRVIHIRTVTDNIWISYQIQSRYNTKCVDHVDYFWQWDRDGHLEKIE